MHKLCLKSVLIKDLFECVRLTRFSCIPQEKNQRDSIAKGIRERRLWNRYKTLISGKPVTWRYRKTGTQPEITPNVLLGLLFHSQKFEFLHLLLDTLSNSRRDSFDSTPSNETRENFFSARKRRSASAGRACDKKFFKNIDVDIKGLRHNQHSQVKLRKNKITRSLMESVWGEILTVLSVGHKTFIRRNISQNVWPEFRFINPGSEIQYVQ